MRLPQPRRFELYRYRDVSGRSGTGAVAWGTEYPDGTAVLVWRGSHPSVAVYRSVAEVADIHGHGGASEIVWIDTGPGRPGRAAARPAAAADPT